VEGTEQFMRLVRETPAGREVRIGVMRGGQPQVITATVGARKDGPTVFAMGDPMSEIRMPEMPPMPESPRIYMAWRSQSLGIEGQSLTPQLAEFFGVKEGVLVSAVRKGTAAEKYGVKAGDVITKIDAESVSSPREITDAIRALKGKKTFPVTLFRDKREQTVTVTLEDEAPPAPAAAPRPARAISQQYRM
jgi:serine protease Do